MNQKEVCRNFYSQILGLDDKVLLERLTDLSSIKYIKKKEFLIRFGEEQRYLYFLEEGILRGFIDKSDNRELTEYFAYKKGTPSMVMTMDKAYPSPVIIQALTDATLITLPMIAFNTFLVEFPALKDLYIYWLKEALQMHTELKYARSLNDKGRCEWFLQKYPELIGRIQKQYIASFLDMTLSSYGKAMKKIL